MNTESRHLLVEYHGCDTAILNDRHAIEALLVRAAKAANTSVVASVFHRFTPQGVSGVVVIEESHLSVHTWPEKGYAAVDFYTCGDGNPELAHETLVEGLKPQRCEQMLVHRGLSALDGSSMRVLPSTRSEWPEAATLFASNSPALSR